ncbi:MAG: HIT family protein [bacterium]
MQKVTKRILLALTCVFVLSVGAIWWHIPGVPDYSKPCAFCDPKVIQTHTFYEDDLVRGLCTHKPVVPGHCMVVVKRHIEKIEDATDQEFVAIGRLIKKINWAIQKINGPSAYQILQKNGIEAGQSVPHVHVHYIPNLVTGNTHAACYLQLKYLLSVLSSPISKEKLAEWVGKMRQELEREGALDAK